jgi:hypothetical protein
MFFIHECPVKHLRFFASLRMTGLFLLLDGGAKLKQLNVISDEVRNLHLR